MKFKLNQDNTKLILIESTKGEYNQLKLYLTRKVNNYRFMKRVKLGVWDGNIDMFKDGLTHELQQKGSLLLGLTTRENVGGLKTHFTKVLFGLK